MSIRFVRSLILLGCLIGMAALCAPSGATQAASVVPAIGQQSTATAAAYVAETEPNGTAATATPLGGSVAKATGLIFPNADIDFYSFEAQAGDRVYAAVMTSASSNSNFDSQLRLIAADGTTELELDNDDGTFGSTSSSIAGTIIPSTGTYYWQVNHNVATSQLRPYDLYFERQSGSPSIETEPNDTDPTANQPLANGWVSGAINPAGDIDYYAFSLNAGDTIFASLDLDPERDTTTFTGRLAIGRFSGQLLQINDPGTAAPDSEAHFMTVLQAGTYYVAVDSASGGDPTFTYQLSVSIFPARTPTGICTTYTSTDVPVAIPTGPGIAASTLTVPGNPRIGDLDLSIQLTHNFMADLDVELTTPGGNTIGLFSDNGSVTVGANTTMNIRLDDTAALPMGTSIIVDGMAYQPELSYRLAWLDGIDAGGTWTLTMRDDATGDGGTLNGWSMTICEPPPTTCPVGFTPQTVFSTDFNSTDGGFTHSGTADEWEYGTPTFAPITSCASGNCWKTDLDNTYDASADQNLFSPNIDLTGFSNKAWITWSQNFQIEAAQFDNAFVDIQEVGGAASTQRLWEWTGATMTNTVGNPGVTIQESSGWGQHTADISSFAGKTLQFRANLRTDTVIQLAGLAIDDVSVTACVAAVDTTITANPALLSNNTSASFSFTGTPIGATFECRLDSGVFAACTSPQAYTGLADGSHTFEVRAIDASIPDATPASYSWTIDATAPDTTITANPTSPINSANASFSFSGSDGSGSGVASFECSLDGSVASACTSPQTYTGLADGSHTFQVYAVDTAGNPDLTPASYTWVVDTTAPTVSSIVRANPSPTNATSVDFTVTFLEAVTGVSSLNFDLTTTGGLSGASITSVTGSGATRTVTVDTGTGDGTLRLDLIDATGIADTATNPLTGTPYSTGESYAIIKSAPLVLSIIPVGSNPTGAAGVSFDVTFSEAVTGVDATDFNLVTAGGVSGASISSVTGSGSTWSVSVSTGTGDGSLQLNLVDDDTIRNITVSIPLGGTGAGNGNFTGTIVDIVRPLNYGYLPLVVGPAGTPDLIVEQISTAGGQLQVTIKNIGNAPTITPFWVDLYINPRTAPTTANEVWQLVGDRGLAWGVTTSIPAGGSLTLTVGDPYFDSEFSTQGGPITVGTVLYAQVDSANANNINGAILESHERTGGAYNNITMAIATNTVTSLPIPAIPANKVVMPSRPR